MSLIFLLFFIYTALAINLFAGVQYKENYNEYASFRNFFDSFLLLIRCATGEDWNRIMDDLASSEPYNGVDCVSQ